MIFDSSALRSGRSDECRTFRRHHATFLRYAMNEAIALDGGAAQARCPARHSEAVLDAELQNPRTSTHRRNTTEGRQVEDCFRVAQVEGVQEVEHLDAKLCRPGS